MNEASQGDDAKILIVDDNTANLDLLRDMLKSAAYSIYFATSGRKALQVAEKVRPDLVLMDVMMPEMDGFTACRLLKEQAAFADTPVIFVTAKTEVEELTKGFEAGAVDYITKPVKQPEVYARVKTHLKIRSLMRQQQAHAAALDRANQELQTLNQAKDIFLSNLGKELTNAATRVAASGSLKDASEVNCSGQEILRLMGTILEWPRLQSGQKLDLLATNINNRELGHLLDNLGDLRFLSLAETRIDDEGLQHLLNLSGLEELHLDHTLVTDAGLALLQSLPNLKILDLKGTAVSDDGLAHISPLSQLEGLYLTRTGIGDDGLAHLRPLGRLQTLILWDTAIGDDGLKHLQGLTGLRELILWNTRVTPEGVARLQQHLPDCDISTSMF
jgi:DNA-binding response OmpR family regulator